MGTRQEVMGNQIGARYQTGNGMQDMGWRDGAPDWGDGVPDSSWDSRQQMGYQTGVKGFQTGDDGVPDRR